MKDLRPTARELRVFSAMSKGARMTETIAESSGESKAVVRKTLKKFGIPVYG